MTRKSVNDCSDLYDSAAQRLKRLDDDIDRTVQDLAKMVEARGVPKLKVARQVVKELTTRQVLSPSRIYAALGTQHKRKYEKRVTEETFPQAEIISIEESSANLQAVKVAAKSMGQSETLTDMDGGPDIRLSSEEQEQLGVPRQEYERLITKEKPELIEKKRDSISNRRKRKTKIKY